MKSDVKFTLVSPLPWKVEPCFDDGFKVVDANGTPVHSDGDYASSDSVMTKEDAELIVNAVNAHTVNSHAQLKSERDELLEALEESYQFLQDISVNGRSQIIAKLGRIIAKARGAK